MTWKPTYVALAAAVALAVALPGTVAAADPAPEKAEKNKKALVWVSEGEHKEGKSAYLGVMLGEDTESAEGGAKVEEVFPDSPAEKAGLRKGDVVVKFGEATIRGPMGLTKRIHQSKAGDKVPVVVSRDGRKETLTVEIGERAERRVIVTLPDREGEDITIPLPDLDKLKLELREFGEQKGALELEKDALEKQADVMRKLRVVPRTGRGHGWFSVYGYGRPRLGVELVETTPDLREFLGGKRDTGVLVGKVLAGKPAEKAGVRVGDLIVSVDGEPVEDSGDLIEALSEKDGKTIDLELVRDRKTVRLKVEIPEVEDEEPAGPRAGLVAPAPPAPPAPPSPPARPAAAPRPPPLQRIPV